MSLKMTIKKLIPPLVVSFVVAFLFLSYMYFIGIPKTRSRNFYNLALSEEEKGNKEKELEYLNTAKGYWAEQYILQKINSLN